MIAEGGLGDDGKNGHARGLVRGGLPEGRIVPHGIGTLVELVLKEITDCSARRDGEIVLVRLVRRAQEGPEIGRNPKTGKEVPISPRRVMVFKPSAILKQRINAEHGERRKP